MERDREIEGMASSNMARVIEKEARDCDVQASMEMERAGAPEIWQAYSFLLLLVEDHLQQHWE